MNDGHREQLLELFRQLGSRQLRRRERSVLAIGGRGYFENPTTDILSFYLDPSEDHGLDDLVLASLFDCIPDRAGGHGQLHDRPLREYVTKAQNRIDLILNGDGWVIALENKVQHDAVNPFAEYRESVDADPRFGDKQRMYIVLAPYAPEIPDWLWISYVRLLGAIRARLGEYLLDKGVSKWALFLREWILHMEEQAGTIMTDEDFGFVRLHYPDLVRSVAMHEQYLQHLRDLVWKAAQDALDAPPASVARNNWGEHGIALRVFPLNKRTRNVTLLVLPEGTFRVQMYVDQSMRRPGVERQHFTSNGTFTDWGDESAGTLWLFARDENQWDCALSILKQALGLLREHLHSEE